MTRKDAALARSWTDFLPAALTLVEPMYAARVCRDPKDDMFLDAAVTADVDYIVSGDKDLLHLKHFHNIPILTPAIFLKKLNLLH